MGKIGQRRWRLVSDLGRPPGPADRLLFCPFLDGLDPELALWLGPLGWHDANACLLDRLRSPVPWGAQVFAGVFCADPFRRPADLFSALRAAGITGVVNLPSVSVIDGGFATTLDRLHLGQQRELAFLREATAEGFRIAACVANEVAAVPLAPELVILPWDAPASRSGAVVSLAGLVRPRRRGKSQAPAV